MTTPGDQVCHIDDVAIYDQPTFDGLSNLPDRQPGKIIIVSQLAALVIGALMPWRDDVFYPATGPLDGATRDQRGVLAVRRLIRAT